jgi:hypothetical protein
MGSLMGSPKPDVGQVADIPPLIALSMGLKVRPRKTPVWRPKEIELQVEVARLLRAHCLWEWTHINRTAKDARQGAIFKRMGVNPSWGDFILLQPHGWRAHFLELKRIGEDVNDEDGQGQFRLRAIQNGAPYVVAWTMKDVLAACDVWGCLRVAGKRA